MHLDTINRRGKLCERSVVVHSVTTALMRLLQFRYAAQVLADVTEAIMVLLERTSTAPRNKAVVRIFQNLYACKRRASAARLSWMYGCLGK